MTSTRPPPPCSLLHLVAGAALIPLFLPLASAPALGSEAFGDYVYYPGDPHSHTGVSGDGIASDIHDGCVSCGALSTVFDYAAIQGLDWVAFSEHSNDDDGTRNADPTEFADFIAEQLAHDDEGSGLVIVPSAEVWFGIGGVAIGHRNLLLFGDDATLDGFTMYDGTPNGDISTEIGACSVIDTWMDSVTAAWGHALLIPHHPYGLAPVAVDWSCHSDTYEPGVEIYSHWGNSLGWDRVYDEVGSPQAGHSVHDAMDPSGYGLRMGFLGGTDSHDTRPGETCDPDTGQRFAGGITMVVADPAETFSREVIYAAIQAHSTYASTGPMVPMTVTYFVDGIEVGHLGQDIEVSAGETLVVQVAIPEDDAVNAMEVFLVTPTGEIPLDQQDVNTWQAAISSGDLPAWFYAAVNLDGVPYRTRTNCNDGGDGTEWLWASPSWFTVTDADADGDGYSVADGDCADAVSAVNPGAAEVWYDGVDQNCDRLDDFDADQDGYRPLGYGGADCDDTDPFIRRPPRGHRVPPDCWP